MILALQTADSVTRLWLLEPATPAGEPALVWDSGRELSDSLLAKITQTLQATGRKLQDTTGIVIFSGPGSFTSLRIGHSVVNALADSLNIPVVGTRGEDWLSQGLQQIVTTKSGRPALPYYGAEAHITKPKA